MRQFRQGGVIRNTSEPLFKAFNANVRLYDVHSNMKRPIVTEMPYSSPSAVTWHASTFNGTDLIFTARFCSELGIQTSQIMLWNGNGPPRAGPLIDVPTPVIAVRALRSRKELLVATGSSIRVYRQASGQSSPPTSR